jgi:hypothetical protein
LPIAGSINSTILLTHCWSVVRAPGSKLILVSLSHQPASSIDANISCEPVAVLMVISYVNNHASMGERAELSAENMPASHHEVRWVYQDVERKVDSRFRGSIRLEGIDFTTQDEGNTSLPDLNCSVSKTGFEVEKLLFSR